MIIFSTAAVLFLCYSYLERTAQMSDISFQQLYQSCLPCYVFYPFYSPYIQLQSVKQTDYSTAALLAIPITSN